MPANKLFNPNVCADCVRWLEDETPRILTTKLLVAEGSAPGAAFMLPPDLEEVPAPFMVAD
jgi:hypothetical protein